MLTVKKIKFHSKAEINHRFGGDIPPRKEKSQFVTRQAVPHQQSCFPRIFIPVVVLYSQM